MSPSDYSIHLHLCFMYIDKIIPHFVPANTGHAACLVISSPSPFLWRLYQKAAEPFFGQSVSPAEGNTVAPPNSTSDS